MLATRVAPSAVFLRGAAVKSSARPARVVGRGPVTTQAFFGGFGGGVPKANGQPMICIDCGYIYRGDFDTLPRDYKCPQCNVGKNRFKVVEQAGSVCCWPGSIRRDPFLRHMAGRQSHSQTARGWCGNIPNSLPQIARVPRSRADPLLLHSCRTMRSSCLRRPPSMPTGDFQDIHCRFHAQAGGLSTAYYHMRNSEQRSIARIRRA